MKAENRAPVASGVIAGFVVAVTFAGAMWWIHARQEGQVAQQLETMRKHAKQVVSEHLLRLHQTSPVLSACLNEKYGAQLHSVGFVRSATVAAEINCNVGTDSGLPLSSWTGCTTTYRTILTYASDWEPSSRREIEMRGDLPLFIGTDRYPLVIKGDGKRYSVGVAGDIETEHSAAAACASLSGVVNRLTGN